MTLLEAIIDLDEILTVNSMWQHKFFEPWAKLGAPLVWKFWENQNKKNVKKPKKNIEYDGS